MCSSIWVILFDLFWTASNAPLPPVRNLSAYNRQLFIYLIPLISFVDFFLVVNVLFVNLRGNRKRGARGRSFHPRLEILLLFVEYFEHSLWNQSRRFPTLAANHAIVCKHFRKWIIKDCCWLRACSQLRRRCPVTRPSSIKSFDFVFGFVLPFRFLAIDRICTFNFQNSPKFLSFHFGCFLSLSLSLSLHLLETENGRRRKRKRESRKKEKNWFLWHWLITLHLNGVLDRVFNPSFVNLLRLSFNKTSSLQSNRLTNSKSWGLGSHCLVD